MQQLKNLLRRFRKRQRTPTVVFVAPGPALAQLRRLCVQLETEISNQQNFIEFLHSKTGYTPQQLMEEAMTKGVSTMSGHDFGPVWHRDVRYRKLFSEALWGSGFSVRYWRNESDGPEADTVGLTVTIRK